MNSINHYTTQASLGLRQTESGFDRFKVASLGNSPARTLSGANQVSALSPRLSALAIGILLLLTPIAHAELENFQAADVVLGQPGFTSGTANNGGVSARSLNGPREVFSDGKRLFISDGTNSRVLIWNTIPTSNFTPADVVLGQPDFSQNAANNDGGVVTARSLNVPIVVSSDGKKLFVADQSNNRILIWNRIPTTNFARADVVLGQPDFNSSTVNNGGISARSMNNPRGVFSDGKRLFVVERLGHRVLIWNKIPSTNFTPADVVIGQPDFTQNTANNGGISARSLNTPRAVFSDGKRLYASDNSNNRILIWNGIPTTNFTPADVVVGQPDFTQGTANNGGVSARSLNGPNGIFSDGKRLFNGEFNNNRTLIWNHIPTSNFEAADIVLGQPDFTSNAANNGGLSARSLSGPGGNIFSDGRRVFITDFTNNRILIYNISGSHTKPDPQFEQGKAVVGKVFNDINGNGIQDKKESGIEGIKVVSDTGIYAITDHDGKYHFPYIETGQHVLKLDPDTLPEGSTLTTDNPYKVTITRGILTKVSFGVRIPEETVIASDPKGLLRGAKQSQNSGIASTSPGTPSRNDDTPLLQLSITQDTQKPTKTLGITAELITPKDESPKNGTSPLIKFTTQCNYYLFVKESEILLYDSNQKPLNTLTLPQPIPLYYEIPLKDLPKSIQNKSFYYQLVVKDAQGHEDRTSVGKIEIAA